ncbi:MAG TPA: aldo/keto reductase [Clostridiaceae bacterium]
MKSLKDSYVLSNGVKIPCVGFGTWQTPDGKVAIASVEEAIKAGYVHIDTAAAYGNEVSVGKAIKNSGIKREDIFITSKLWNAEHGYESTKRAFAKTLADLKLEYLDLYLIHWPIPVKFKNNWEEKNAETWRAFEELYKEGKIKAIGVSNFLPHHIEALTKTAKILPMVDQIKLHPGVIQEEIVKYCMEHRILLEAWSPLASGSIFGNEVMEKLSKKYNKSIAQICIRWSLDRGFLPLPKSVTASRIIDNTRVFDFSLEKNDIDLLNKIVILGSEIPDPDHIAW